MCSQPAICCGPWEPSVPAGFGCCLSGVWERGCCNSCSSFHLYLSLNTYCFWCTELLPHSWGPWWQRRHTLGYIACSWKVCRSHSTRLGRLYAPLCRQQLSILHQRADAYGTWSRYYFFAVSFLNSKKQKIRVFTACLRLTLRKHQYVDAIFRLARSIWSIWQLEYVILPILPIRKALGFLNSSAASRAKVVEVARTSPQVCAAFEAGIVFLWFHWSIFPCYFKGLIKGIFGLSIWYLERNQSSPLLVGLGQWGSILPGFWFCQLQSFSHNCAANPSWHPTHLSLQLHTPTRRLVRHLKMVLIFWGFIGWVSFCV